MPDKVKQNVCRRMKYKQVVDNMGHQFSLLRRPGSVFYILLRGEAEVYCPNMATQNCKQGDCFGSLHMPKNVRELTKEHAFKQTPPLGPTMSQRMFDLVEGKGRKKLKNGSNATGRVKVYIKKGSEYATCHSTDCLPFLKQWSEKLSKITLVR